MDKATLSELLLQPCKPIVSAKLVKKAMTMEELTLNIKNFLMVLRILNFSKI
jgi:hypothetical protein